MELVKVIIPIYKNTFTATEKRSLMQAYDILKAYPLVVIKPESLDLSELQAEFPRLTFTSFDDAYFKGISGYNRLMLASGFYERFLDSTYILIYQLDAFVFRDELKEWCSKGYDYIGAPWLQNRYIAFPLSPPLCIWHICTTGKKESHPNKTSTTKSGTEDYHYAKPTATTG